MAILAYRPNRLLLQPEFPFAKPYELEVFSMDMLKDMHVVNRSTRCRVMKGTYQGEKCLMKIVDASLHEQVDREVIVYKILEKLQGTTIPKFLGYGSIHGVLMVLILEDCGEPGGDATADDFVGLLEQRHGKGVLHGDVAERNIVRCEFGQYVLIDFGHSEIDEISGEDMGREIAQAREELS